MNQSGIIQLTNGFCRTAKVTTKCRFISHRPHNNRWMVSISFHHTHATIHISYFPAFIVCNPGIILYPLKAMAFQICFINDIKSILIAQIIKILICRIMRTTYCIDIVLFHQTNIRFHQLSGYNSSFFWIIIMMIDSV